MKCLHSLLDIFFPRHCLNCQQNLSADENGFICPSCFHNFVFNPRSACYHCGRFMGTTHETVCQNCLELQPYFKQGISLFAFNNLGRQFIHTLKYHHGTYLEKDISKLLEHEQHRLTHFKNACFVPVPLHFSRLWHRGYNQSEIIAKALQKHCHGHFAKLLIRKNNTRSQTSLTRNERKKNVENAFKLKVKNIDVQILYVLVDDVFTTGATLNECAKMLHLQGAKRISVFTLAHS